MSKRIASILLGTLSLFGASAASAQVVGPVPGVQNGQSFGNVMTPETQNRTNNTMMQREFDNRRLNAQLSDPARLRSGANEIASCLVRRGGDRAGSFVGGALVGDPDYKRISDALTRRYSNCANGTAAATASAISGALVEQLLEKQAPTLPDRAQGVSEEAAQKFFGTLSGPVTLEAIAGCIAVYSPGLVYKLIQTEVGSGEETAALQAVYAQSPECKMSAPPPGVDAELQRSVLATALYKWTNPGA